MSRATESDPLADARRLVARRPRTAAEVRAALADAGHGAAAVEAALERLTDDGALDDEGLALHWIIVRSERLGHGPRRLTAELERRGVAAAVAERAWDRAVREGHVDPADMLQRAVARRLAGEPELDDRARRRVYNALLRAGFEADAIRSELDAQRSMAADGSGDWDDDLA